MMNFVLFFATATILLFYVDSAPSDSDWENFKQKYNKNYADEHEELHKYESFISNKERIEAHNREYAEGLHKFNMTMNEFGDLTHEEFVATMNGFNPNYQNSLSKSHGSMFLTPHNIQLPCIVDWRKEGYVTPVKNQGHCGSCWAFSATGALEGQHKRKNGTLVSLSEQNLIDCAGPFGGRGCSGGLMNEAFQYIKSNGGIDKEISYPYEAKEGGCRYTKTEKGATDTGFVNVVPHGDEQKLKEAVGTVGPVSVAIDGSLHSFQFPHKGVYYDPKCSAGKLDHGILVVGYGITEDDEEYWLIKNSWGTSWGDEGFLKMARNKDNLCGIATLASYPLV